MHEDLGAPTQTNSSIPSNLSPPKAVRSGIASPAPDLAGLTLAGNQGTVVRLNDPVHSSGDLN